MDVTLLHHTLPLGVTVALHQACPVAKKGSLLLRGCFQGSRQAPGPGGFRKERAKVWKGVFTLCASCEDALFEHDLLWTFSQEEAGRRLTRTPLLWWVDGYVEDPFFPVSSPLSSSWPPTFVTPEVTVGWFESKIVIFLLQKCLGQTSWSLNLYHKMEQAPPGGQDVPTPVPASPALPICP